MSLCGPDFDYPPAGDGSCCMGAAVYGPERCTCWTPEYNHDQEPIQPDSVAGVMPSMCGDCAFKPRSPERTNSDDVRSSTYDLDRCVRTGDPFWCHNGLRRVVAYTHQPTGTRWVPPGAESAYDPPIVDRIPYKADGTRGDLCAGYTARRRAHLQQATT